MYYPKFLKKNDTIGICAPSAGVGRGLDFYEKSVARLIEEGFKINETFSVRVNNLRSNNAENRAQEFNNLIKDNNTDMVICAAGGDFLCEIMPLIDWEAIKDNPKWIQGASDPTNILYPITTKFDIATMYGLNANEYHIIHQNTDDSINLIQGNMVIQHSYNKYQLVDYDAKEILYTEDVIWKSKRDFYHRGRLIGGCIDVIKDLMGTPYDGTKEFIERYKDDGIIWYIDNYALSAESLYRTLLQMKYAGYFKHTKAIIIGRVCFESSETGMTYQECYEKALENIDYVYDADIGHTNPKMTLINGAIINIEVKDKKGVISFELK